jgi:MFS transporter
MSAETDTERREHRHRRVRPDPGLLRERNFRLLWTGETISGAGSSMASIAGRSAAGLAADAVGAASALLFNSASFLVSAACLLRIRLPETPARPARPSTSVRHEAWLGIRLVARDPYLRPLTLYPAAANLAYTGNLALTVVFLVRVVGLGATAVGLLTAAAAIGGLLGAACARRLARAFGSARALIVTSLGSGLAGLLIPLTAAGPRLACYVAGSAAISGGIVVGNVIIGSFRQAYCPPSMLGRVTASMRFLAYGAVPLGALAAGALGTALGVRDGLWIVQAAFAASGALLLTRHMRTVRNLPARN